MPWDSWKIIFHEQSFAVYMDQGKHYKLSVIIPCFNEEGTISHCVERLRQISDEQVSLEIIIVDDGSTDRSLVIAQELAR